MGTSFYKGLTGPLQQWWEQSFDPSSGFTYHSSISTIIIEARPISSAENTGSGTP
jgi:hypothetical protein